jgi:hypothetical protein
MSRLPMLPGRVPAAAACLSRPEDPRSVAEALYDESLGDDVDSNTLIAPAKTRRAMPSESLAGPCELVSAQIPRQTG